MRKKGIFIVLLATLAINLTGCNKLDDIIEKNESDKEVTYSNDDLIPEVYYIKSGTRFYPAYMPSNQPFSGKVEIADSSRVAYFGLDEEKIPTLYKGESIALASSEEIPESITLERFKDIGYSIGVYNSEYNHTTKAISFPVQNVVPGCSLYNNLSGMSRNYKIVYVNDAEVSMDMLNTSGVFSCFEEGEKYRIGYYAGTYYDEIDVMADVHMLCSYEIIHTDALNMTKNGYASYMVPEDLKSGYYFVEGQGFFKYVAAERGTIDESAIAWNEPYYDMDNMQYVTSNTQNYTIELDKRYTNIEFEILYEIQPGVEELSTLQAVLYAPSGMFYYFTEVENGRLTCALNEASPGKWMVAVSAGQIDVTGVSLNPITVKEEVTVEEYEIEIAEDIAGMIVTAKYSSSDYNPSVYAMIITPNGESYQMYEDKQNDVLEYKIPYAVAGTYIVKVYHYSATEIISVTHAKE